MGRAFHPVQARRSEPRDRSERGPPSRRMMLVDASARQAADPRESVWGRETQTRSANVAERAAKSERSEVSLAGCRGPRQSRLVRPARLERATSWFVARRSIQLSYGRANSDYI